MIEYCIKARVKLKERFYKKYWIDEKILNELLKKAYMQGYKDGLKIKNNEEKK